MSFFLLFVIPESFAQYMGNVPLYDERTFYDYNGTNWNFATSTENGITITLETNKVENYSEFEAIRIKANVTNLGSSPILYSNVISSCHFQPVLKLKSEIETFIPKHWEEVICISSVGEAFLLPEKSSSRDIMWKQQVPPGNYVLMASFNGTSVQLPIIIVKYGVLESSIQNTKALDLSPKKQFEFGIPPENIRCKEGLELIFKSTVGSPACVNSESATKLIKRQWGVSESPFPFYLNQISNIKIEDDVLHIRYSIDGGTVESIQAKHGTLLLQVSSYSDGSLNISIPSSFLSGQLSALIDGVESDPTNFHTDTHDVLSASFPMGTEQIEFIGTVVP